MNILINDQPSHYFRSYVCRNSRETNAQRTARQLYWPQFGLNLADGLLDMPTRFGNASVFLEIGFGSGVSLLSLANQHPDQYFIGIETYHPGIGTLLSKLAKRNFANLFIYQEDAVKVMEHCLPANSLEGILIFFPDPWPKRRHHLRRLVQVEFIEKIMLKLKNNGILHLATDWQDYAYHMMNVCSSIKNLLNAAGLQQFTQRSPYRPSLTKFEKRALSEQRQIWELQFYKN